MGLITLNESEQVTSLEKKVIGIYGRAGIGKSHLASFFEGVYFAQTEAGLGHLKGIKKTAITSWETFMELCKEFTATEHPYKSLCIDTFDNLTKLCTDFVCRDLQIDDIGDYKKFGAYHIVTAELHRVITKLSMSGKGLILTSHVTQEEMESKIKSWMKSTVSVSGKNKAVMVDICDPLLFIDSELRGEKEIGIIRTKPSIYWEAKDKLGALPETIEFPLNNPKVAYDKIVECFNGKEKQTKGN